MTVTNTANLNISAFTMPSAYKFVYNPTVLNGGVNPFSSVENYTNFLLKSVNLNTPINFNFAKIPSLFNISQNNFKSFNNSSRRLNGGFGSNILSSAYKYLGYNENNGSYKLFTNGRTEAWCADFVSYVVKEAARKSGKSLPSGFGSASVEGLRQWGLNNNCYLHTANSTNKKELIKNNVKPGDIVIFKENGRSHTGVVASIDSNGNIKTVEGNTSDKVGERTYSANNSTISGFVQLA